MDANLKFFLENQPTNVKELARLTGRSQTWVRDALKKFKVPCRKDSTGTNIFFLVPADQAPEEPVESVTEETPPAIQEDVIAQAEDPDAPHCPSCHSTDVVAAGEPGSFLGAALTCQDCGKTHNAINGKEIAVMARGAKAKRKILNPQYKIRAKTEAVEAAGGTLTYDKMTKKWIMTLNGTTHEMTAQAFADLTPETIVAL